MGTVRYTNLDGQIIAENRNGVNRSYVPDAIGSTVALVDDQQQVVERFGYWPYGASVLAVPPGSSAMRFAGTRQVRSAVGGIIQLPASIALGVPTGAAPGRRSHGVPQAPAPDYLVRLATRLAGSAPRPGDVGGLIGPVVGGPPVPP